MRDLLGMMKQAKELQERMQQMQAELENVEVDGASGGGLVTVRVTAKGECKAIHIDPSLLKPDEAEIVEDLIVAALADARGKAERVMQEKMQALTGGLALPPGMKLF
ncbi:MULTISPECIES: YbaB/EbfC family nucleoid-associated protein [unclassified Xanthobacter]|uniref:YbaB/EbfC family nucleoid-associated protein n=1 Tax=unclassified Xanthobacter TaxID=2623496 RepID=UPI001EDD27C5|nr:MULTISPECIES: YbaB/EbfC family nucleoid-associated protein [unclassified Xanthobacter]